ncbi:cyclopropane-fatty-acyl-phospholipid synthase [Gluconacetobacter liquefaciens]|uniref:Class I SAM-dependent methyltransferase n=1 Tax=Gluconacetobacter liquefaciens TaxID=89584 RepID=A0A370FZ95_GLULI|nr:cyclopropane-fatty-acyl-phospholipid synthase family protein [Gluconacetobacter liquefaciens]MBB2186985.1 class I SAM-dependent methyltransferase [Gluconacetobacter liquefaciens]RDI36957.1 cyclopropane-fatty-acyl-phospholipid synthase [Gluconacetobacter liquefaciens]GEB38783.1 cyclopropane-fatty-acyl-phospholipid synthase [Gluconacetobacter liquefaciens]
MSIAVTMAGAAERLRVPDPLLRLGINSLVARTRRNLAHAPQETGAFAASMADDPIALHTADANRQHYELPPEFFGLVLGPKRKYSCSLYPTGRESLEEAEEHALEETAAHAGLADGQDILELGCGWGSLSLFMAARFPASRITAVSNAGAQRGHIEARARTLGLGNLRVITADMNDFVPDGRYDRVVSVEMFEHMANWRGLLRRIRGWLKPEGRLFLHVFAHAHTPYRFDHANQADWIARHFFTGGIMPNHALASSFPDLFTLERDWRWSGTHYARTARAWLGNYDRHAEQIRPLLADVYGPEAMVWTRRWRLFFLATEALFGHGGGKPWGVSHYLLAPTP